MPLCTNCKTLIRCIGCGKQICKLVEQQHPDTFVEQQCTTEGFYNLEVGKVCVECHVVGTATFGPRKGYGKTSSR